MVCHATGRQFEANIAFFPTKCDLRPYLCAQIPGDCKINALTPVVLARPQKNSIWMQATRIPRNPGILMNHKTHMFSGLRGNY